jgi:Fe-S oxidoreductase
VLDLCLECKACKSECPTHVDMARLKAEFLHQYFKKHGLPWRNWIFGNVATLGKWGRRFAPMSNEVAQGQFTRWLNEKLLGIDRRRLPPSYARIQFWDQVWKTWHHTAPSKCERPVLLFPDTFINFHEPATGLAAVQLLHRTGCSAIPAMPHSRKPPAWLDALLSYEVPEFDETDVFCCGRPFISNGMLDQAIACAKHNVKQLHSWTAEGKSITACEPSCILTIKDDYPALLRGEERKQAETVAAMCFTFEELLEKILIEKESIQFRPGPKKILVQGHCHQQSLVGMGPTLRLLRRIPGAEVIDLDAGCCGLAGSFGYEKEHYEISRLVGEQRLFPALRKAEPGTVIVAPGFSCRLQIKHFTGLTAVHPAELLASLLP